MGLENPMRFLSWFCRFGAIRINRTNKKNGDQT